MHEDPPEENASVLNCEAPIGNQSQIDKEFASTTSTSNERSNKRKTIIQNQGDYNQKMIKQTQQKSGKKIQS